MDEIDTFKKLRSTNRITLLKEIHNSGPISRIDLAKKLGLSKSTVSENINQLLDDNVVLEVGIGNSQLTGGRRPVLLQINGHFCFIIIAELGVQEPIFALADLNGNILAKQTIQLSENVPYSSRLCAAQKAIEGLLKNSQISKEQLGIIALSSPGAYSKSKGAFILNPEFENWNVSQFSSDVKKFFQTDVYVVNDVNAAAIGELHYGSGNGFENILFISCGLGIGVGLILNGTLYTGQSGSAGEIAQIAAPGIPNPIRTHVEIAQVLNKTNLDMPDEQRKMLRKSINEMEFQDLVHQWKQRNPYIQKIIGDVAAILGKSAASITSLLNCELVILGGEYLVFKDQIIPMMNDVMKKEAFDPVSVVPSKLGKDASLYGLLSLSIDMLIERLACGQL
ncbi:MAG: ROK family transcriptional regulator [Sporolactobacillus sp.]